MIRGNHPVRSFAIVVLVIASMLGMLPAASAQGNSEAAHACQGEGYLTLVGINGETFDNVGQCVRFAAQGGVFDDGTDVLAAQIVVPAGFSVTFSNHKLAACNGLTSGYSFDGGVTIVPLASKPATSCQGGDTFFFDPVTIGPVADDSVLVVYLTDTSCGVSYGSDGDHARVIAMAPVYEVDIADAGSGCNRAGIPVTFSGDGNLSVTVTVHP